MISINKKKQIQGILLSIDIVEQCYFDSLLWQSGKNWSPTVFFFGVNAFICRRIFLEIRSSRERVFFFLEKWKWFSKIIFIRLMVLVPLLWGNTFESFLGEKHQISNSRLNTCLWVRSICIKITLKYVSILTVSTVVNRSTRYNWTWFQKWVKVNQNLFDIRLRILVVKKKLLSSLKFYIIIRTHHINRICGTFWCRKLNVTNIR